MKVFVANYEHRNGNDIRVFATAEGAEAWRQFLAAEWWDTEIAEQEAERPEDPKNMADLYWEIVGDRTFNFEYFSVEEHVVET